MWWLEVCGVNGMEGISWGQDSWRSIPDPQEREERSGACTKLRITSTSVILQWRTKRLEETTLDILFVSAQSGFLCPPAANRLQVRRQMFRQHLKVRLRGRAGSLSNKCARAPTICVHGAHEKSCTHPSVQPLIAIPVAAWIWRPCIGVAWWGSLQLCQMWSPEKNKRRLVKDSNSNYSVWIKTCESPEQDETHSLSFCPHWALLPVSQRTIIQFPALGCVYTEEVHGPTDFLMSMCSHGWLRFTPIARLWPNCFHSLCFTM